jgi:hypothetical protein
MNSGGKSIPRTGLSDSLHFATGRASGPQRRLIIANNAAGFAAATVNAEEK